MKVSLSSIIKIVFVFFSFALIHSVTVSSRFKRFCTRLFGDTFMRVFYRALFTLVSVITLGIAVVFIARVPDRNIWTSPVWLAWPMHAVQALGLVLGVLAFEHIDAGEFLGIKQVLRYLRRGEVAGNIEGLTQQELVTTGVYGVVRHPLYVAGILIVTFNPDITVRSLTITILSDLYFLFGMLIEERRFLKIFGDRYREYMARVPRMIPSCRKKTDLRSGACR